MEATTQKPSVFAQIDNKICQNQTISTSFLCIVLAFQDYLYNLLFDYKTYINRSELLNSFVQITGFLRIVLVLQDYLHFLRPCLGSQVGQMIIVMSIIILTIMITIIIIIENTS